MDALKFFKEKERLCDSYTGCETCPLNGYVCDFGDNPEKSVAIVEQWSKEHPKMTNASKLLEVFGRIRLSDITPDWLRQEYREPKGKK